VWAQRIMKLKLFVQSFFLIFDFYRQYLDSLCTTLHVQRLKFLQHFGTVASNSYTALNVGHCELRSHGKFLARKFPCWLLPKYFENKKQSLPDMGLSLCDSDKEV
jgi:hypothetical protein